MTDTTQPHADRPVFEPSAKHPITITPTDGEVTVELDGTVVARSSAAVTLAESTYPTVQYIPIEDVDKALLQPSDHSTYCPFKGEAGYYSLVAGDHEVANSVWFYEKPFPAVAEIAGRVAFYTNKPGLTVSVA